MDTAILVFARTARTEAGIKFNGSRNRNFQGDKIAFALLNYTLDQAVRTSIPVVHVSETGQSGDTFGERFTAAFKTVFDKGYQKVIAIGSDCPSLNTVTLSKAAELLRAGCPVLGPAKDGGLYLVGMHKDDFDAQKFESLGWQTGNDFEELKALFTEGGKRIAALRKKRDVDHISGLTDMGRHRQLPSLLFYQIISIVCTSINSFLLCCYLLFSSRFPGACHALRAPPFPAGIR